jgi:hypothetical protein
VLKIPGQKKFAALIGAFIYLLPPIPYIASIATNTWLNRRANKFLDSISETLDKLGPTRPL